MARKMKAIRRNANKEIASQKRKYEELYNKWLASTLKPSHR